MCCYHESRKILKRTIVPLPDDDLIDKSALTEFARIFMLSRPNPGKFSSEYGLLSKKPIHCLLLQILN